MNAIENLKQRLDLNCKYDLNELVIITMEDLQAKVLPLV